MRPLSRRNWLKLAGAAALFRGARAQEAGPIFSTVPAEKSGITWVHQNARSEAHWLPESMCSGCAFLDYDNDGWMDIFLVNTGVSDFYHPAVPPRNALYKNNRDGTFTDVTHQAGLEGGITFGEGVAVGDYNGDGYPDLYVTGYGHNILYRNNGNGTFTDVTEQSGLADPNWSTSAVWFDYDNDGRLDLFVCSFVDYSAQSTVMCGDNELHKRYYCVPRLFKGRPSKLYHNNGDGTFTEVGHATAIGQNPGKAHGVVATDVNNDGLMDLWVANDTIANFLFLNRGQGKFEEVAFNQGIAYSDNGQPRSGMGVDSADFNQDGRMDLFVSNIDRERFSLYQNEGEDFSDRAFPSGIGPATQLLSGWGLKFFDYDNDGDVDLILANGHPDDMVESYTTNVKWAEPLLLFHNEKGKNWTNVSAMAGPAFQKSWPARGLAVGDFDNDGGVDVLISNNGGAPLLLHNEVGRQNNWLGLKLVGVRSNIDAIGARVTWSFNGVTRSMLKTGGGSFLSSHDPRLVLGIGQAKKIDSLEVKWPLPSGKTERFTSLPINRYITIKEDEGIRA